MKTNTKIITASLSLLTSIQAFAGLGGLNVQSNLGEPFSGSIVVTGQEAQALLQSGTVSVSGGGVEGRVIPQGNGNAVIRLKSSAAVQEPVLTFIVKAGNQTRQYSAMINPPRYAPAEHSVAQTAQPSVSTPPKANNQQAQAERKNRQARPKARARQQVQQAAAVRAPALPPRDSNAQYHQVQPGEHLAAIAEQYRPHNMTLQQAMRALVRANPRAFRNGNPNLLYGNTALYIPTDAQWRAYASGKGNRRGSYSRIAPPVTSTAPTTSVTSPVPAVQNNATAPAQQTPASEATQQAPTTPQVATNTPSAAASTPKPAAPAAASASTPEKQPVAEPMASGPATASQAIASTPTTASAALTTASAPITASAPASAPASAAEKPPVKKAKPQVQPVEEPEEQTDWLQYGLMGAAGLAVLGGAAYLLKRRRPEEAEESEDDEFVVESVAAPTAAEAAQRVDWQNNKAVDELDNLDETLFDSKPTQSTTAAKETFNLDDFEPQIEQMAPEEKPDWLAELEAETGHSNTTEDNHQWAAGTTAAAAAGATAWSATADNQSPGTPAAEFNQFDDEFVVEAADGDQWLEEVLAEERAQAQAAADDASVHDLVFDDFSAEPETVAVDITEPEADRFALDADVSVQENIAATELDTYDFADLATEEPTVDFSTNEPEEQVAKTEPSFQAEMEEPVTVAAEADLAFDDSLNFDLPKAAADDLTFDLPEAAADDLTLNAAPVELPAATVDELSFDLPQTATDDLSFDVADDNVDATFDDSALTPTVADDAVSFDTEVVADDQLALTDDLSFSTEENAPLAVSDDAITEPFAQSETFTQAENTEPVTQQDVGFVTGAIGMEAPLEAKLELAKMYLEIDDAVAARETLRELIGESHGDLQAQAQALLNELGG